MEWISVKDRLPDSITDRFIVCLKNKMILEMYFSNITGSRWFRLDLGDEVKGNPVTHWMEFPKPPKRKKRVNNPK